MKNCQKAQGTSLFAINTKYGFLLLTHFQANLKSTTVSSTQSSSDQQATPMEQSAPKDKPPSQPSAPGQSDTSQTSTPGPSRTSPRGRKLLPPRNVPTRSGLTRSPVTAFTKINIKARPKTNTALPKGVRMIGPKRGVDSPNNDSSSTQQTQPSEKKRTRTRSQTRESSDSAELPAGEGGDTQDKMEKNQQDVAGSDDPSKSKEKEGEKEKEVVAAAQNGQDTNVEPGELIASREEGNEGEKEVNKDTEHQLEEGEILQDHTDNAALPDDAVDAQDVPPTLIQFSNSVGLIPVPNSDGQIVVDLPPVHSMIVPKRPVDVFDFDPTDSAVDQINRKVKVERKIVIQRPFGFHQSKRKSKSLSRPTPKRRRSLKPQIDEIVVPVGADLLRFLQTHEELKGVCLSRGKRNVKRNLVTMQRDKSFVLRGNKETVKDKCRYDDHFVPTEEGKLPNKIESNEFVVAWYLWCPGKGNCKRKCGAYGMCMEGKYENHFLLILFKVKCDFEKWA